MRFPALVCLLLSACAGPVPPPPRFAAAPVPAAWTEAPAVPASAPDIAWPQLFDDRALAALMARVAAHNEDVLLAGARLREARAASGAAVAAGQVRLAATASYARERDSLNAPRPLLLRADGELEPGSGKPDDLFQAGFDASWEADLFGARAHAADAAQADAQAAAQERGAVLCSVLAEVARNYIVLRVAQQQGLIARADLAAQDDMLVLVRARRSGGYAVEADVARAGAERARLAARIPAIELDAKRAMHRIAALLGQAPGALTGELGAPAPVPALRAALQLALPSETLRRRPDIRSAERQLAAATARRASAVAELFPHISLTGSAGVASVSASDLFSSASLFAHIGPSITWPILRRGQIVANIEVRGAQQEQAFVRYRRAIIGALEETENALAATQAAKARAAALDQAVRAGELALELAGARYRGGMADFRSVLEAQHGLAQARSERLAAQGDVAVAAIALYKSAGGDWQSPPAQE